MPIPILAAIQIGSAIASMIGTALNAKGNADERRQMERNRRKLDSWYEKEYNTNYMDTDEGKATMTLLRNQLRETKKVIARGRMEGGKSSEVTREKQGPGPYSKPARKTAMPRKEKM